jgi:ribonuclease D
MGLLKKILAKSKERKEQFQQMQQQDRLQTMLEERKKSANRREYERLLKQKEEDMISERLKQIRRNEARNLFTSEKPILRTPNIFKDNKNIFANQKNIFRGGRK